MLNASPKVWMIDLTDLITTMSIKCIYICDHFMFDLLCTYLYRDPFSLIVRIIKLNKQQDITNLKLWIHDMFWFFFQFQ